MNTELYWIATNKNLDLELRYAAAREMQQSRMPEKPIVERKYYTDRERRMIRSNAPAKVIAAKLERSVQAVYNQRKTEIRSRYR